MLLKLHSAFLILLLLVQTSFHLIPIRIVPLFFLLIINYFFTFGFSFFSGFPPIAINL
uniref:Uncharacterized protein n=1 Tax=uncultured marine virus TaxID=186617 RepID=A0A0F7L5F7_9VIRU|nr:hypothetical protein [uncultured marine virus]